MRSVDEKYYEVVRPQSITEKIVIAARNRMYRDFIRLCKPQETETIADIGVSDVVNEAANVVERLYPYQKQLTGVGIGDGIEFKRAYPDISYVQIKAGAPLPFQDKSFSFAISNAVLEHVGNIDDQRKFVDELRRIAHGVFITVPHKYFPIEHHTAIPFFHYWGPSFAASCKLLAKREWLDEKKLSFISRSVLKKVAPTNEPYAIGYTGLRCGFFSSNLYLYIPRRLAHSK